MSKEEIAEEKIDMKTLSLHERILRVINLVRIEKNGKNTFANYEYFKPEEIYRRINPLLDEYKIFPHFSTLFKDITVETTEDLGETKTSTLFTQVEVARLTLKDVYNPEIAEIYEIPLVDLEIKGANKMQSKGGARTYAKRYLYMEAFNISDNTLDLDSNEMSGDRKTMKPASKDDKTQKVIAEIKAKIEVLRGLKVTDTDIVAAIKAVYTDGGKPSANYNTCKNPDEAKKILDALGKLGG